MLCEGNVVIGADTFSLSRIQVSSSISVSYWKVSIGLKHELLTSFDMIIITMVIIITFVVNHTVHCYYYYNSC